MLYHKQQLTDKQEQQRLPNGRFICAVCKKQLTDYEAHWGGDPQVPACFDHLTSLPLTRKNP